MTQKAAPSDLTILESNEESITISFNPVEGAKGYTISIKSVMTENPEWKTLDFSPEQVMKEIVPSGYVLKDLEAAHTYQLKAGAYFDDDKKDIKETDVLTFDTQLTNCVPESRCCVIN